MSDDDRTPPPEEPQEPPEGTPAEGAPTPPEATPTPEGAAAPGGEAGPAEGAPETPETPEVAPGQPEATPEADQHGFHLPPHEPGFVGTLKSIRHALRPVGRKRVIAASLTVFGIGIGALLLVSGFSFWWTSQPSFCAKCHPMQKYVDAWEEGPHAEVNCEECHLTPGLFGFIGGKIAGLQVVMNYVRGNYEDYSFNAAVANASCLKCHEGILSASIHSQDTGITVSHKDIIESGGKCMSCHSTVGHGDAVPPGSATHPTMQTCLQCHNDEIAPLDCDLCHVGKKPSPSNAVSPPPGMLPSTIPTSSP